MGDIKHNIDPTTRTVNPNEGYNPFENPGIQPSVNDKVPAGESETNKTQAEKPSGSAPKATGSGY
jgi:hypothetical protein